MRNASQRPLALQQGGNSIHSRARCAQITSGEVRPRTKGTQSPLTRLPLFVCIRFQDLFHSPPGVLFAFPSRYLFTIGRYRVFSLGGWSPHVQTRFLVPRPTFRYPSSTNGISYTGLSPTTVGLSIPFYYRVC